MNGNLRNLKTVGELLPHFLQSRVERNLRPSTMMNYRIWEKWMHKHWGQRLIARLKPADIVGLLTAKSRNHAMMAQVMFRWLISEGGLSRTFDCGKLPLPPRSDEKVISYLSPEESRRFLEAVKPEYKAAFVLALYAGLRPYECARIHWESIHVKERRLRVEARVSKIRRARIIEGVPTILWQSLRPHERKYGRVITGATSDEKAVYRILHERARAAREAEVRLGHDILRHTFATHYVALTGNLGTAAKILGHYDLSMLSTHYDGVTTRAEGKNYFARGKSS